MGERRLNIPGTHNFRDTDGYPARGGVTRAGQLYRSDSLHAVPAEGIAQVAALGIEVIVDLRSPGEISKAGGSLRVPGAQVVEVPIFGGSRRSMAGDAEVTLERMYRMTLHDYGPQIAEAVTVIAATDTAPTLVCCTAGKDRTGLVVALALHVAGVEERAIVGDYAQSALNLDGPWLNEAATDMVSRGVPLSPNLFAVLGGSPAAALSNVLSWLTGLHGSIEDYLINHGMPRTAPAALRAKLIRPV